MAKFKLMLPRLNGSLMIAISLLLVVIVGVIGFELVYAGRIYPGVSADGVLLSGLNRPDATAKLNSVTAKFTSTSLPITYGKTVLRVPTSQLGLQYNTPAATDLAYRYGREGSLGRRLHEQLRALLGRETNFADYHYDDAKLALFIGQLTDDVVTPVSGPSLSFAGGQAEVARPTAGRRLDGGQLAALVSGQIARTSGDAISAPVYDLPGGEADAKLDSVLALAKQYLDGPITINYASKQETLDQSTIATWLAVSQPQFNSDIRLPDLNGFYHFPQQLSLSLSQAKISAYVDKFTASVNHTPHNATLGMADGKLTVLQPSQAGTELNRDEALRDITAALIKPATDRTITLNTKVTPAEIREDNLDQLGIKELISEGQTFFPGSPSTRLINVRAGATRFNGILLKPGQVFSFGALLGDVGPQTGYVPELVILGDHEEKQYGGGLCQVSSTAFRAALNAGLPILERVNHAFAISYYTAPFGVPGVDATIYYPDVDLKFRNDTSGYILIQTKMVGTTLTFDYYGTKAKSGVIRGPNFVTGSSDATQPSHTVFYRDVLDLNGNVVKTDTFNTFYKSSKDFPITKQFN